MRKAAPFVPFQFASARPQFRGKPTLANSGFAKERSDGTAASLQICEQILQCA
jgi:hypothetical protein